MKLNKTELTAVLCFGAVVLFDGALIIARLVQRKKAQDNMERNNFINPFTGRITSKFGLRVHPITGVNQGHNGVDVAVPTGTTILAPADGTVVSVYSNSTGGNQLIVRHANGWKTGYAHLTRALVSQGQTFKQGQAIALSGNSGASTGAHVHFTLTNPAGTKVDPLEYFTFKA